jgi:formyl-CoA transferase
MQNTFPKLSETPGSVRSPAPQTVGEHNAEVYGGVLHLTNEELAELQRRKVI